GKILFGILLIIGRYTTLALTAMIPITFGILGFHLAVDLPGIVFGLVIAVMHTYLIFSKRSVFAAFIKESVVV
ncbi:MAG: hypothetical protein AB3N10_21070, partial [Allomuricauda sp.]